MLRVREELRLGGGALICNPLPPEAEIPAELIAGYIAAALADAEAAKVSAKEVTPYLLKRMFELTGGESLKANIALILNNARLAARIALALS